MPEIELLLQKAVLQQGEYLSLIKDNKCSAPMAVGAFRSL